MTIERPKCQAVLSFTATAYLSEKITCPHPSERPLTRLKQADWSLGYVRSYQTGKGHAWTVDATHYPTDRRSVVEAPDLDQAFETLEARIKAEGNLL